MNIKIKKIENQIDFETISNIKEVDFKISNPINEIDFSIKYLQ